MINIPLQGSECVAPELVAHQAVHDEVGRGDKAEEDVRHEAQQVIPDREAFSQVTLLYTGPGNKKWSECFVSQNSN